MKSQKEYIALLSEYFRTKAISYGVERMGRNGAARQPGPLHRRHGVGDDVQPALPGQAPADLQSVGQQQGVLSQHLQVQFVAPGRIPIQAHFLQKTPEPLHHQKVLGALAPVKGRPHGVVAPLIALKALLRVRDVISGAHLMKSVPVSRVKIKQCVVCVQQQIGVFHVVAPVIIW